MLNLKNYDRVKKKKMCSTNEFHITKLYTTII